MDALTRAHRLEALLRCAMLAEENETSGVDEKGLAMVLQTAVDMANDMIEDVEALTRKPPESEAA